MPYGIFSAGGVENSSWDSVRLFELTANNASANYDNAGANNVHPSDGDKLKLS